MDTSSLIVIVMPVTILVALFTAVARASGRKARPVKPGTHDAAPAAYLYVPCTRAPRDGSSAGTRRWVQEVPIVRTTSKWIYYTSETWDRREAVVSPGCISREEFEADTRCRGRHGYPAGVIPIPGGRARPGPAGRLFFATRQTAEAGLYRGVRERAEPAAPPAPHLRELRRAMAEAHPDRGGTADQFIQARRRYQTVLASTSHRKDPS